MKPFRLFSLVISFLLLISASTAWAVIDDDASVVKLRDPANGGCTEAGVFIDNCFETIPSLSSWIPTRAPDVSDPLLVEIGPGAFGKLACAGNSYITFRGAGIKKTRFETFTNEDCTELSFSDMSFTGAVGAGYSVTLLTIRFRYLLDQC
jgi:hypothetical protein